MRTIEFRGRNIFSSKWVYGSFVDNKSGAPMILDDPLLTKANMSLKVLSYNFVVRDTVGQYIGLKDKNGTKIFEGDIMRYLDWSLTDVIYGEHGTFAFSLNHSLAFLDTYMPTDAREDGTGSLEVVGNKWDNPELLETILTKVEANKVTAAKISAARAKKEDIE